MKKVVHKPSLKIIEVEDDFIECSVCNEWKPQASYTNEQGKIVRTNCEKCYHLSFEEMKNLSKETDEHYMANRNKIRKLQIKIDKENEVLSESVSVEALIKELQKLPKNSRVLIEQVGYYCETNIGEIYDTPEKFGNYENIYSIGLGGSAAYC